jgi:hypothetical protein
MRRVETTITREAKLCRHRKGRAVVDGMWTAVAVGVAGAILALVMWRFRRERQSDMGAVSRQWVAEHRLGEPNDRQR